MKIGENLKKLRKRANLTQQEVSRMLGFKNHTGYAHWEGDRTSPSVSDLEKIANVFAVSIFEVLGVSGMVENGHYYEDLKVKVEVLKKENAELKSELQTEKGKNQGLESLVLRAMAGKAKGVIKRPKFVILKGGRIVMLGKSRRIMHPN